LNLLPILGISLRFPFDGAMSHKEQGRPFYQGVAGLRAAKMGCATFEPVVEFPPFGRQSSSMTEKRPHDMGGEPGGPIDTVDHGMKFWEKQANALRNTLTSRKVVRLDELRRAAEDLGERYHALQYFERTTHALRTVLLERGLITEAELAAKMAEVRKRYA
jgi:hypothetical protein